MHQIQCLTGQLSSILLGGFFGRLGPPGKRHLKDGRGAERLAADAVRPGHILHSGDRRLLQGPFLIFWCERCRE